MTVIDLPRNAASRPALRRGAFPAILEQHAELVPGLWARRVYHAASFTSNAADLRGTDERLRGNLDGLALSPEAACTVAAHAWRDGDPGEAFAWCALSLRATGDLSIARENLPALQTQIGAAASAVGFLPRTAAGVHVIARINSAGDAAIAARAGRITGTASAQQLRSWLSHDDPAVQREAVRFVCEQRAQPFRQLALESIARQQDPVLALHALLLGGELGAVRSYLPDASSLESISWQRLAMLRLLGAQSLRARIVALAPHAALRLALVRLTALHGDCAALPWLASCITNGVNAITVLEACVLMVDSAALRDALSALEDVSEDAVDRVAPDLHTLRQIVEHATAPAVRVWPAGTRILGGLEINEANLMRLLARCETTSAVRRHAAVELAAIRSAEPLINTAAPAAT